VVAATSFQPWIEKINTAKIDWENDTFSLLLADVEPVVTDSERADISEVSYTNLSSRTLTLNNASQTGGTYTADCDELVMTASGAVGPFRYVVLCDESAVAQPVACWWDYGSDVTMASGDTFTFPAITLWFDEEAP